MSPTRNERIGAHIVEIEKRLGRPVDSAEGEYEYIQRMSYNVGFDDGKAHSVKAYDVVHQQQMADVNKKLEDALTSLNWYAQRHDAMQKVQKLMRDPERTIACDILANGHLLRNSEGKLSVERYGELDSE